MKAPSRDFLLEVGRRRIELERILRFYFLQQWFNLSDPSVEESLHPMSL
ncbi:MAG: transposase, partial [Vulcanimicrobiaceae bacterium]